VVDQLRMSPVSDMCLVRVSVVSCLQCFDTVGWWQKGRPACNVTCIHYSLRSSRTGRGRGSHWPPVNTDSSAELLLKQRL